VHFRKTSNTLDASVQSEQMCFQKSAEAVSGTKIVKNINLSKHDVNNAENSKNQQGRTIQ